MTISTKGTFSKLSSCRYVTLKIFSQLKITSKSSGLVLHLQAHLHNPAPKSGVITQKKIQLLLQHFTCETLSQSHPSGLSNTDCEFPATSPCPHSL